MSQVDRTADCGPVPKMVREDIVAAANRKWWWAKSKDLVILDPARAAWSIHQRPPEYGYVAIIFFVRKGTKDVDPDQMALGAFYKNGMLTMVDKVFSPIVRTAFLDTDEMKKPSPPAEPASPSRAGSP